MTGGGGSSAQVNLLLMTQLYIEASRPVYLYLVHVTAHFKKSAMSFGN